MFVEIASGNFGTVYKAVYEGHLVVVKVPKEANLAAQMTECEARLLSLFVFYFIKVDVFVLFSSLNYCPVLLFCPCFIC